MAMVSQTPPQIFDSKRTLAALSRSMVNARRPGFDPFLDDDMAEDLIERFDFMQIEPASALLVGVEGAALRDWLTSRGAQVTSVDPLGFDEEQPWPAQFDLIVSLNRLDRVNDLPGALLHMCHALANGGIAVASMLGAGSLPRLRSALFAADGERPAARLHPMVDTRAAAQLMQRAGFNRQVVDSRTLEVRYGSLDRLVADLRAQGLTNQLASRPPALTREGWKLAREAFLAQANPGDSKVTERFEILTLTGWR